MNTVTHEILIAPKRDLALDFANTVAWRGSAPEDSLGGFEDLVRWCSARGALDRAVSERIARWAKQHPQNAAAIIEEAKQLREAIYRICFAAAERKTLNPRDLAILNRAMEQAPARTRIVEHRGKTLGWQVEREGITAANLLADVLWSAGDLVTSDMSRVRHCSNPKCVWLFLDDSKNGTRRWCSMQSCGNRAKAHRHYLKTRRH
jgi:predicted RNA-binding Zn ribbon-like protein